MKKIFLMSALSVAVFGTMNAQTSTAPASQTSAPQKQLPQVRAKAMVSKINNACGLQGEQIGKVNNLYIEYFTKLDGLGQTPDGAKVAELKSSTETALKAILTPAQVALWQKSN